MVLKPLLAEPIVVGNSIGGDVGKRVPVCQ